MIKKTLIGSNWSTLRLIGLVAIAVILVGFEVFAEGQQETPRLIIDTGGSTRFVKNVIFTKDGKHLVSIGDDKVVRVWNVFTGKTVRTIRSQASACTDCIVSTIALSPNNSYLAVGGMFPGKDLPTRFAIYLYRFETGELLQTLKGHRARVISLTFSDDSNQLASGSTFFGPSGPADRDSIRIWKAGPERWDIDRRLSGHGDAVSALAFSPDGNWLSSGSHDNDVRLWDLTNASAEGPPLKKRHSQELTGVSFSPDGKYLASGGLDGKVNLWSSRGDFLNELSQESAGVTSIAFSPDKTKLRLAIGLDNGACKVLSIPDGAVVTPFKRFADKVWAIGFTPDGANIASTGGFNGEISLWETETGKSFAADVLAGSGQTIWSVGFAKDGNSIAYGTQHDSDLPNRYGPLQHVLRLRQGATSSGSAQPRYRISLEGRLKNPADYVGARDQFGDYQLKTRVGQTQPRRLGSVTVDEVITFDRVLQILKTGSPPRQIVRTSDEGRSHKCYTFTSDANYIVSGGERGYLGLYETESGRLVHTFFGHTNDVWSVAVSDDDQFLVSGSSDQTVRLWDLKSGRNILTIFVGKDQEWVAWTPAGYYTSSATGDKYFGWQVNRETSESAEFFSAAQFSREYYRPDVIAEYFRAPDIQLALTAANEQQSRVGMFEPVATSDGSKRNPVEIQTILPPSIVISSPAQKESVVSERLLRIRVQATSSTMPITEVKVALNGVPKGTFKGDVGSPEESKRMEVEMVVALEEGENNLYVVAANAGASSNPEIRKIVYKPANDPIEIKKKVPVEPAKKPGPANPLADFRFERTTFVESSSTLNLLPVSRPVERDCMSRPTPTPTPEATPTPTPEPTPTGDEPLFLVILSPRSQQTVVQNENLNISVQGHGRERRRIELKVLLNDDPPVGINRDAFFGNMELQVNLKPGQNVLRFTVSDGQTTLPPQIRRVTYNPRTSEKPNLIFLGIGISKYQVFRPPLRYADKDAKDLATLLCAQEGGGLYESVKVDLIADEDASRTRILEGLRWLNSEAKYDNDIRVVLIAGHGGIIGDVYYFYSHFRDPDRDPEEDSIRWSIFWEKLKRPNSNAFLFVDTCHSGGASRDFVGDADATGVLFFSASTGDQTSAEDPTFQHGVFTQALLEALRGGADTDGDKHIDSREIERFIETRVESLNSDQTPVIVKPRSLPRPIRLAAYP